MFLDTPKRSSCRFVRRFSIVMLLACVAHSTYAATSCSMHHAYPGVVDLNVVDGQLVATLGQYFVPESPSDQGPIQLVLNKQNTWRRSSTRSSAPGRYADRCDERMQPPLDIDWLKQYGHNPDPNSGFNQEIEVCTSHDRFSWGGISFYSGEDSWGVGGIVRKSLTTGEYVYYRPYILREYSVSEIQYFDKQLWLGTTHNGECAGLQNGYGLQRFNLLDQNSYGFADDVPEVCGFAVRKFVVFDGDLWVASDLGLARSRRAKDGKLMWQNYVPDSENEYTMRPVECPDLYEELLHSSRIVMEDPLHMGFAFDDFWYRLSQLRREFVASYLRKLHNHPE